MPSFPLTSELPPVVETTGWEWSPFEAPVHPSNGFWLGVDPEGHRWLTKLTGSFYAYREIVFDRLAQAMGWSCQSSVFMRLDAASATVLRRPAGEIHAAHWFLNEHGHPPCAPGCALEPLVGKAVTSVDDLANLGVMHIIDWPKSELAAYLFGGNEPPGRLFTVNHEFVIIDSELMFSTGPCPFDGSPWVQNAASELGGGCGLAVEVCRDFAALSASTVAEALALPPGIVIEERWPIAPLVHRSLIYAQSVCSSR
jgi:hypothetical protein